MTTWWTLMKDTTPIATYEFAGTSLNMLDEAHAYDVMDFLERHGAPALFAPINESVVLVGGSWSGKPVWQLVREGSKWLTAGQVEWNFRLLKGLEHGNEAKAC